jgi:hypothetical protein
MTLPVLGSTLVTAVSVLAVVPAASRAQKAPALPDLLRIGAHYVSAYAPQAAGTILEEQYVLIEIANDRMVPPRRVSSDVVLVNINGQVTALRDAFATDTRPLRERTLRINAALERLTQATWTQAQEYARQSFYLFYADIVVRASEPTLAFQFLDAATQPKLTYRLDGRKSMNGVQVTGVRFDEPRERLKTYHLGTRGNASASGRFWIDPATGAIHQTELWLESPTEVARVTVAYIQDPKRSLLVPKEMTATFEQREIGATPTTSANAFNARQRFECTAKYSNVRFLPIEGGGLQ